MSAQVETVEDFAQLVLVRIRVEARVRVRLRAACSATQAPLTRGVFWLSPQTCRTRRCYTQLPSPDLGSGARSTSVTKKMAPESGVAADAIRVAKQTEAAETANAAAAPPPVRRGPPPSHRVYPQTHSLRMLTPVVDDGRHGRRPVCALWRRNYTAARILLLQSTLPK